MADEKHTQVLVVGGGIAGVTTAVEIAEMGYEVILVEKSPSLGGRVARMSKYFPKLCPPWCGLEINYRRIKDTKNIKVLTMAEVTKIEGEPRNFTVTVKQQPRFVNPKNEQFDKVIEACETEVEDEFNLGMCKTKAIGYYHDLAFPRVPYVDAAMKDDEGVKAAIADSGLTAFDLDQTEQELTFKAGAIVWATGWRPYEAEKVDYLGYAKYADVIQNVEMERLCSPSGPTEGKLLRPSDGKEAKRVAFLQCSGSRDANYLPYCSGVCCLASLKQANYVRERYEEDGEAFVYYIDIRSDRYYDFLQKVEGDEKIHLVKGKAGGVTRDDETGDMIVLVEDVQSGEMKREHVDLVVLATGMVPMTVDSKVPCDGIEYDAYGFITSDPAKTGIFPVGVAHKPLDVSATVQEATGVSIKAIQTILGG